MSIRTKVSVIVFGALAACVGAVSLVFLGGQLRELRGRASERVRLHADTAARVAKESLAAKDDLMLMSHLDFLLRQDPAVLKARVLRRGTWFEVAPRAAAGDPDQAEGQDATIGERREVRLGSGSVILELHFSKRRLEEDTRKAFRQALDRAVWVTVLIGGLALVLAMVLGRSLTRPVLAISQAMGNIGRGNLGTQVKVSGSDELGAIGRGFNEMSQNLLELDRMKKRFVASVTHELRSPLGAIESYIRMVGSGTNLTPEQHANLRRTEESAARLGRFITNLLDEARIESGKLEMSPKLTDLARIAEDTVLFYAPRAKEAGLELTLSPVPGLPKVWADPDRIEQVLVNLVSNALKFTPRGGRVIVSLNRNPSGGEPSVVCAVQDTGVGISKEDLGRIFKPFERAQSGLKAQGAGLGLAIVKHIVELHGGTLRVESEPGRGSKFYFALRCEPLKQGGPSHDRA